MSDSGTRINKFLSEVGYCSRRQADALIDQGRGYVNRKPAKMGMKVSENDMIEVRWLHNASSSKHYGIQSTRGTYFS